MFKLKMVLFTAALITSINTVDAISAAHPDARTNAKARALFADMQTSHQHELSGQCAEEAETVFQEVGTEPSDIITLSKHGELACSLTPYDLKVALLPVALESYLPYELAAAFSLGDISLSAPAHKFTCKGYVRTLQNICPGFVKRAGITL
jgi:hypothetical protein